MALYNPRVIVCNSYPSKTRKAKHPTLEDVFGVWETLRKSDKFLERMRTAIEKGKRMSHR